MEHMGRGARDDGNPRDRVDDILAQWARARPDLDATPMGVVGRLSRLARHMERAMEGVYAAHGLSGWGFDVLASLRRAGPPYRLTPTALYHATLVTSGAMTHRLARLERTGLIARLPNPGDRRSSLVALTPRGREVVDAAVAAHLADEDRLLAPLDAEERAALARSLRALLTPFEDDERGAGAPPAGPNQGDDRPPVAERALNDGQAM